MQVKVILIYRGQTYRPVVEGKIKITRARGFAPSSCIFNIVKDDEISYNEGAKVIVLADSKKVFVGYVFKKGRDKEQIIKNTCYDQLRYFKNKDTILYDDKTYSDLVKELASKYGLLIGNIEDTSYKIPGRIERNKELFSIFSTANDLTIAHTGEIFNLYDKEGYITLKNSKSMIVKDVVNYDNTDNFDYQTSIENSYNRVKLSKIDDEKKEITSVTEEDMKHIEDWGLLQYFDESSNEEDSKSKAKMLLELHNKVGRSLRIKETIGNFDVYGGSLVPVYFPSIGDIHINSLMFVDKVEHFFDSDEHFMNLTVYNKDIMPGRV